MDASIDPHIDMSAAAIDHATRLAQALNWFCDAVLADGRDSGLPADTFDVIYVAGLAGQTLAEKQEIVDAVRPALRRNGRLVLRSAHGARELFGFCVRAERRRQRSGTLLGPRHHQLRASAGRIPRGTYFNSAIGTAMAGSRPPRIQTGQAPTPRTIEIG